ncbi:MAG: ABC transporter ATP-binding protein [Flavobacteriales bacterium]|nr:ABC transporter ATP-binding protein [Flavobacteriales bacterium]MCC6938188.1 ABC transporter ATP-binding protein [Flavobacteriales bacterium]
MNRIAFQNLGKRYGKQWALRGVSAAFAEGEVVMVIGPNGSGKTTLIKCLLGLVRSTEGSIAVNGTVIGTDPSYRAAIGYMPQLAEFPKELTVEQLLRMMNDIRGARSGSTDDRLIASLGVDALLDKRISNLSGGMRQKVSAVLAFRYRPNILVLDEPTAGLDPISAGTLLEAVLHARRNGATVLITSHIMEEVQRLGDRVAYLQDGLLRFALPPETITEVTGESVLSIALPKYLAQLSPVHVEGL